jgi:adenylate cyclase class 2
VAAPGVRRNIELKARDASPERSLEVCRSLGAVDHGLIWQRDTYFAVPRGRLKLREQHPGHAELIQYERRDHDGDRESIYRITEVGDPGSLRTSLENALDIAAVVEKRRHLFLWQDVRIHLDEVAGLGSFIEFEAVAAPGSELTSERRRVQELRGAFRLLPGQLVASSYSDLLQSSSRHRRVPPEP